MPEVSGLEGVVAATSSICDVNGIEGRLIYQGYDIHDLVAYSNFEEVVYLLWHGKLPTRAELEELRGQLSANRALPEPVLAAMRNWPAKALPMDVLRTTVSLLSLYDPDQGDDSEPANIRKSIRLTARMGTIVAAWDRSRNGAAVVPPDPELDTAANFLYMLKGQRPDEESRRAFDICLILHADHELNASTFAARVTAATLSDMYSSITSAVGALAGPLHGGANVRVMQMLQEIGDPSRAEEYIRAKLARHERIMGFGHRVYKTEDPRAMHLRRLSKELGERTGDLKWYEISRAVEEVMRREMQARGRDIYPNVDFYSASVYHYLGIPQDLFTPVFAVSRVAGWTAHVLEQLRNNRLIRPRAEYVGPRNLRYIPIDQRG
jgi:citrate synthase